MTATAATRRHHSDNGNSTSGAVSPSLAATPPLHSFVPHAVPLPGQLTLVPPSHLQSYPDFLQSKFVKAEKVGFKPTNINSKAHDWQAMLIDWHCRIGRSGSFADTGLGKTLMQLEFAHQVCRHTNGDVLIVAPLAVAQQTKREAEKFGVETDVNVCRNGSEVRRGITVVNYDRLHLFDVSRFAGVVLDESDILQNFSGKVRKQLTSAFATTRYKLPCSATPAPNDHVELGNHSEFLNVMPSSEMLARWFANDTMKSGGYKLKKLAEADFWRWVTSWAVCVSAPSDLGFSDDGYILPPLRKHFHEITADSCPPPPGCLFHVDDVSATNMHSIKRKTAMARASKVAEIIAADPEKDSPWLLWCDTNYEADAITAVVDDIVEVRGSDNADKKEERLLGFMSGSIKRLLSKPEIAGHGLNLQHCHRMIFVGLSFSFKRLYQAIRRCWRFGQLLPVDVHIVYSDAEATILNTIAHKEDAFATMRRAMQEAVKDWQMAELRGRVELRPYEPTRRMELPSWLAPRVEGIAGVAGPA